MASSDNVINTFLSLVLRCFAPPKEAQTQQPPSSPSPDPPTDDPQQQPPPKPPMSDAPFSYADAVASNVDEQPDAAETAAYVQPPTDEPPAAGEGEDYAVEAALEEAGGSVQSAIAQLWKLDGANRLTPGVDYQVNVQRKARSYEEDHASEPFVEWVSDAVWERPTWGLFKALLDNYTAETGIPERKTAEEMAEESDFLDAVLATPVGQFARRWLAANTGLDVEDPDAFKQVLHDLWFKLYSRDGGRDSSGFEHFIGEIDDGKVKGLHNFVQVYCEEQKGNFNYRGFLTYGRDRGEYVEDSDRIVTIRFSWLDHLKPASTMFVGTTPEFEIALYSLAHLAQAAGNVFELGPYDVTVKVYEMYGCIGSAFPELSDIDYDNPDAHLE